VSVTVPGFDVADNVALLAQVAVGGLVVEVGCVGVLPELRHGVLAFLGASPIADWIGARRPS
jgi:hypothetical protein